MTFADSLLDALAGASRPLDDDEIAKSMGVVRQQVNQTCRRLAESGLIRRETGPDGKLVNWTTGGIAAAAATALPPRQLPNATPTDRITEDEAKAAVRAHLEAEGFTVTVAWGRERGVDISARRGSDRWLIEAKGGVARGAQQVNYFLGALGELVQRMADETARYGLALPDDPQYRGLVRRLPGVARRRLALDVFFVRRTADGLEVDVDPVPAWTLDPRAPMSDGASTCRAVIRRAPAKCQR